MKIFGCSLKENLNYACAIKEKCLKPESPCPLITVLTYILIFRLSGVMKRRATLNQLTKGGTAGIAGDVAREDLVCLKPQALIQLWARNSLSVK